MLALGGLLAGARARSAAPPPTVSIVNPGPGSALAPAPVSPGRGTNAFKVQVQVWNDVADVGAVQLRWCRASADPDLAASWSGPVAATPNAAYACGVGCAVHDAVLTALAPGDYRLVAEATSALDGMGRSSDRRQGEARWVHVRVLPPGTGTGTLLVRDSASQLCMDCHALSSHSSQASGGRHGNWQAVCLDCHTPHDTRNLSLVRETIQAPDGVRRPVRLYAKAGDGPNGPVDSAAGASTAGVCQVCHTQTQGPGGEPRWRSTGNADPAHYQAGGPKGPAQCTPCHTHTGGFSHAGSRGAGCERCHGHDAGWGGSAEQGAGTSASHSTHTEGDADDLRGPNVACGTCHDVTRFPLFASGVDADGDGRITLAETDVCDGCHSPGGPVNGVDDPVVGARASWRTGAYAGATLAPGKERWCLGCHDAGASPIPAVGGRPAPDVAGDGVSFGYYLDGHGRHGTECAACHDEASSHGFDGRRTYAGALDNYGQGYRLRRIDAGPGLGPVAALNVPREANGCDTFAPEDFALCLSCHDAGALLSDVRAQGRFGCTSNPYRSAASLVTAFRNVSLADPYSGGDPAGLPANLHADHLVDASLVGGPWTSDGPGTGTGLSATSCPTCHDPHGGRGGGGAATQAMTHAALAVSHGADATGTFGRLGSTAWLNDPQRKVCGFACHGGGERWYQSVVPAVTSVALADAGAGDPGPADGGFTNGATVTVTLAATGFPAEMNLAQDAAFQENPTGWRPFSAGSSFTLTPGDGTRTIFVQLRTASGVSAPASASIVLDTVPPTFAGGGLAAPNGGEAWGQGSVRTIRWGPASDPNLRPSPISLALSLDGGATYPLAIASAEPDDGQLAWTVPTVESATARVRVTATDRAGNQGHDASDGNFAVVRAVPIVDAFAARDADPLDPAPAEAGFTNSRTVAIAVAASGVPAEMELAEDAGFTLNATGWRPFAPAASYQLSIGDGTRALYLRLRNASGASATAVASVTLDTVPPALAPGTLTAPRGGERWPRGAPHDVTWLAAQVADANLPPAPISLDLSTDSGATWSTPLAAGEANDGSWAWALPSPLTYRARVRLTVTDRAGNRSWQASGADFAVTPPYLVTTTADSGAGSLRQALASLAAAGGNDAVWFDVPAAALTDGVAVVNLLSKLTLGAPGMVVDAASQTGLQGDTNPRGPEVRLHGWSTVDRVNGVAFHVTGPAATIRGFQLTGFHHAVHTSADSTTVQGNHFCFRSGAATPYTAAPSALAAVAETSGSVAVSRLRFGGAAPAERNHVAGCSGDATWLSSGVRLFGQEHAVVNNLFGLVPGGAPLANGDQAAVHDTGLLSVLSRNQVSGAGTGFRMAGAGGRATGNLLGLYFDGSAWAQRTAPQTAIALAGGGVNVVGGWDPAASDADLRDSNVIASAAAGGTGVSAIQDDGSQPIVAGNYIGTNPARTQRFTGGVGVRLAGASLRMPVVGGDGGGWAGNVIAFQSDAGVLVGDGVTLASITGNAFEGNGASAPGSDDAIRLVGSANGGITRPAILDATAASVTVTGVAAGDLVEVYRSDYDGSGSEYGEGRVLAGSAWASGPTVVVDVSAAGLAAGQWVTALRSAYVPIYPPDPYDDPTWYFSTSAFSANLRAR